MAVLLAAGNCFPADITTLDGITYKEAKVTSVEADGVHITHRYGVAKVLFDKLPGEIRRQYETKGVGSPKAIVEKRAGPVATTGELASRVIYDLVALAFVPAIFISSLCGALAFGVAALHSSAYSWYPTAHFLFSLPLMLS